MTRAERLQNWRRRNREHVRAWSRDYRAATRAARCAAGLPVTVGAKTARPRRGVEFDREMCLLLNCGYSKSEIARRLRCSRETIRRHLAAEGERR